MRSKSILVAIMLIALPSLAAAQQSGNLLINPSAESGTGCWKMMYGNTWTVKPITPDDPDPAHETYYFYPGNDAATELGIV